MFSSEHEHSEEDIDWKDGSLTKACEIKNATRRACPLFTNTRAKRARSYLTNDLSSRTTTAYHTGLLRTSEGKTLCHLGTPDPSPPS